jgi:hypothetical protein
MEEEYVPKPLIEVEYYYENDDMTDEEYSNQETKKFVITKDMIIEMIEQNVEFPEGMELDWENIYISKL